MKKIEIFTDGSCLKNPGPGGYGVILKYKKYKKIISKGFYHTTNNRMELMAAIAGLEVIEKTCNITLTTDSMYLKLGISKWIKLWKKNNWVSSNKKPIKNKDLWNKLNKISKKHIIKWKWTKGHLNNYENNLCDKIAKLSSKNPKNKDIGFYY